MNKEEVLDLLKHLILQLRDHSKEIQADPKLMKDWVAKSDHLAKSMKALSSCDSLYIADEYGKWWTKEIKPYIAKLDPKLLKHI